jgi:hypothetical protein
MKIYNIVFFWLNMVLLFSTKKKTHSTVQVTAKHNTVAVPSITLDLAKPAAGGSTVIYILLTMLVLELGEFLDARLVAGHLLRP